MLDDVDLATLTADELGDRLCASLSAEPDPHLRYELATALLVDLGVLSHDLRDVREGALRQLMREPGATQREVAERCGISRRVLREVLQ